MTRHNLAVTAQRRLLAVFTAMSIILGLLAISLPAQGQPSTTIHRIGILGVGWTPEPMRQSLRDLGYIEGRNLVLEIRDTEGRPERATEFAAELVRLGVHVIVATHPAAVFSAKRATATIPIVMMHTPDPVQLGLVASLARPGGNITGLTTLSVDLSIKQLELLKAAVAGASKIAVLWNPDNPWNPLAVKGLRDETRSLGVQLQILGIRGPQEFDHAFHSPPKSRGWLCSRTRLN